MPEAAIIGAGLAGLTAAYELTEAGWDVQILEATSRPGGVVRSTRTDGFLVEHGPNTVRSAPILEEFIEALDLKTKRQSSGEAAKKRYVVRDGQPVSLPTSPGAFLTTPLLSGKAKARLFGEPFIPATDNSTESVASFVRRRLGSEVLDYLVNPFVGGVFAGDPESLSLRHAFPRLHALERDHGSLLWGALRRTLNSSSSDTASSSGLVSFDDGLEVLPRALADRLSTSLHYETPVTALRRHADRWRVVSAPANVRADVDAVVYAAPLHRLEDIQFEPPADLSPLRDVPYPPITVLALGYRREDVRHPLDGFGVLVPAVENDLRILGTVFSSTLFPDRAPEGHVLLTAFLGGSRRPALCSLPDEQLRCVAETDLRQLLDVKGAPVFVQRIDWPQAIPQYHLEYRRARKLLGELEARFPDLGWAGNFRKGISVPKTMQAGRAAARRLIAKS